MEKGGERVRNVRKLMSLSENAKKISVATHGSEIRRSIVDSLNTIDKLIKYIWILLIIQVISIILIGLKLMC